MDFSCARVPHEQQVLGTPDHCIPPTPEKSITMKKTLISVFDGQGVPAFESLVDVPIALLTSLPEKSASSSPKQFTTFPAAPANPGSGNSVENFNARETTESYQIIEDLNNKGRPKEFDMFQTIAIRERMDFCADNGFLSPVAPLTPCKDKTTEEYRSHETTEASVKKRLNDGNIQENCMNKKVPSGHVNSSLEGVSPQCLESERDEDEETLAIDLNKTPRKKLVRRKKHRPKVIQEGKPIKSPGPVTPKTTENKEKLIPKRTYVRKKKALNSSRPLSGITEENKEKPVPMKTYVRKRKALSSSETASAVDKCNSIEVKIVDQFPKNATKSVKRRLNFSSEGEATDGRHFLTGSDVGSVAWKTSNGITTVCSREFKVELTQGLQVVVTKSPAGIAFDLNRSLNQVLDEYIRLPENLTPTAQSSRRETIREHWSSDSNNNATNDMNMRAKKKFDSSSPLDIILKDDDIETKRDQDHFDASQNCSVEESPKRICFVHGSNGTKQTSLCKEPSSLSPYLPVIYKKRRTERQTSGCYRALLPKLSRCFTFADAQWPEPFGRWQQSEFMLAVDRTQTFDPTHRPTRKRSKVATRARKPIPIADAEDCSHLLGSPEVTKGSYVRLENKNYEFQSCIDALSEDTRFRVTTKKRRNKGHFRLVSSVSSTMKPGCEIGSSKFSFLGQRSDLGLATSQWMNLNQLQVCSIRDCHSRSSNVTRSFYANFQPQTVVPYMDPVQVIVERMKHMKISEDQIKPIDEAKNALIPYSGGSMMVPYERFFDIIKKKRPRAKVDLDPETNRVWNLLMGKQNDAEADGVGMDKQNWWEEEREVFRGRADAFIARMHLILGDRRFSKWKGSVVDSVVGVFLTQNVSDHLSSSAFMSLAARFPLRSRDSSKEANAENMNPSKEQGDGNILGVRDSITWQEKMSVPEVIDPGSTGAYEKEKEAAEVASSLESNNRNETDYFEANSLHSNGRENGIGTEALEDRMETPTPATGILRLKKAEDRMTLEDIVFSKISVKSLDKSSEYQMRTTGQVALCLGSATVSEHLVIRSNCSNSYSPTSFIEHSLIREASITQESNNKGNGGILSAENMGNQEAACMKVEKRTSLTEKLCGPGSACPVNTSNILVNHPQHGFEDMSPAPSMSHQIENSLNSEPVGMGNADIGAGGVGYCMSSTASEITQTCDINVIKGGRSQQTLLSNTVTTMADMSHVSISKLHMQTSICSERQICLEKDIGCHNNLPGEKIEESLKDNVSHELSQVHNEQSVEVQPEEREKDFPAENTHQEVEIPMETQHCGGQTKYLSSCNNLEETTGNVKAIQFNLKNEVCGSQNVQPERGKSASRSKKAKVEKEKKMFDWDGLRKEAFASGAKNERSREIMDSLDWEAVRNADVNEISKTIRERGMNNVLAQRIKDFLDRLVNDHGSIDLEWLRNVPPEKAKDYLLSIRGLGLKSVECVRLLTLHHLAFPVDTNVGRICVRLGWVPLQPLPESLQLHLLELYPVIEHIQKYLWPRLCNLDQRTLYELHYQMITFGKVFCTKTKPNCNACPMRGECKHFASAFASARLALPGPEEKRLVTSRVPSTLENDGNRESRRIPLPQVEGSQPAKGRINNDCQPIIEEPATPEHECTQALEIAIEDAFYEDPEEIPTIKLSSEQFKKNLKNYMQENKIEIQDGDMSKALVAITAEAASIPMPKLKNVSRLRTEHLVYELPDSHPLLEGMDHRVPDDPCPYLLAIWAPGETAQSTEPPQSCCNSQDSSKLCDMKTCFACNSMREAQAQTVRGTILIPCRTAMRGSFPLNGTYFQVNEVFADHRSSRMPIDVPRKWIWNLPRRTVFFGTSIPTIFRGLTMEGIQHCFWRGFVCVRGFDQVSRAPKPLYARLHFPPSKAIHKNTPAKEEK